MKKPTKGTKKDEISEEAEDERITKNITGNR
jgi:hypothetical protein